MVSKVISVEQKKIATNYNNMIASISTRYENVGYSKRFIEAQIDSFNVDRIDSIIPLWLFEEIVTKPKVFVRIPLCSKHKALICKSDI